MTLHAFKRTKRGREWDVKAFAPGKQNSVARTWLAISLMTVFGLFTVFAVTMAASHAANDSSETALGELPPAAVQDPRLESKL